MMTNSAVVLKGMKGKTIVAKIVPSQSLVVMKRKNCQTRVRLSHPGEQITLLLTKPNELVELSLPKQN